MTGLAVEKSYPWVLAVMIALLSTKMSPGLYPRIVDELFGHAITASSIIVGFLSTTQGVLVSISERPKLKRYMVSDYYPVFLGYMRHAIGMAFCLLLLSAIGTLIEPTANTALARVFIPTWVGVVVASITTTMRVASVTSALLQLSNTSTRQDGKEIPPPITLD